MIIERPSRQRLFPVARGDRTKTWHGPNACFGVAEILVQPAVLAFPWLATAAMGAGDFVGDRRGTGDGWAFRFASSS